MTGTNRPADWGTAVSGHGPLEGVRVVELTVWVAGPAAGGIMSDWGADVIKVEPPAGDPQRSLFGSVGVNAELPVPPFEMDNRGKRSVVLDLRDETDRAHLDALIATADVFITNMRPGALERLGLDHTTLCKRHPGLVYGSITGYGMDGPDRDRAGYDTGAYWARSGLAHTTVPPGEFPVAFRSGAGDHQTGMTLERSSKDHARNRQGRLERPADQDLNPVHAEAVARLTGGRMHEQQNPPVFDATQ